VGCPASNLMMCIEKILKYVGLGFEATNSSWKSHP
jgi:hypothetical protein